MENLDYKELFRDAIHTIAYIARAAGFDPNDPTVEPPAIIARIENQRADLERLTAERAKLEALATELFDGVPTSPENALTWLHQEVMRALTTPNWPSVLVEILLERGRQIEKGYTAEHDDKLTTFELSTVAAAVTLGSVDHLSGDTPEWAGHIIEKHNTRRRLVIAAALVVAEIERLDRKQSGRTA